MDSLTQIVLGSAVGVLVMGRSQSVAKSAFWGGVCGTLPDLDAFIDHGDPILNMVRHRAETHALAFQSMAAPIVATGITLLDRNLSQWPRWLLMVWLVLITHAGLDAMTVYGTRLLLPHSDFPFGVGSIFIIDPLYTLPLLFGLVLTLGSGGNRIYSTRRRAPGGAWVTNRLGFNLAGIVLSSVYLAWSWFAQGEVKKIALASPQAQSVSADRILVTPTAFNTLLWRVVIMHDEHFDEGFFPVINRWLKSESTIDFDSFARDKPLDDATVDFESANEIRKFSRGFYRVSSKKDSIRITDLRMGQEPYYVFSFEFARQSVGGITPLEPTAVGNRDDVQILPYLKWVWSGMWGEVKKPTRP